MRKLIVAIMLTLLVAAGASWGQLGTAWTWADSTVEVDKAGVKGVRTVDQALTLAKAGYTIILHPGSHALTSKTLTSSYKWTSSSSNPRLSKLVLTAVANTAIQECYSITLQSLNDSSDVTQGAAGDWNCYNCVIDMNNQEWKDVAFYDCFIQDTLIFSDTTLVMGGRLLNGYLNFDGKAVGTLDGVNISNGDQDGVYATDSTIVEIINCYGKVGNAYAVHSDSACILKFTGNDLVNNSSTKFCLLHNSDYRVYVGNNSFWNYGSAQTFYINTDGTVYLAPNLGNNVYYIKGSSPEIYTYGWQVMHGEVLGGINDETIANAIKGNYRDILQFCTEVVGYNSTNTPMDSSACVQADLAANRGSWFHFQDNGVQTSVIATDGRNYGPVSIQKSYNDPEALTGNTLIFYQNLFPDTLYLTKVTAKSVNADYTCNLNLYSNKRATTTLLEQLAITVDSTQFQYYEADSSAMSLYKVPPYGEIGIQKPVTNIDELSIYIEGTYIKKTW